MNQSKAAAEQGLIIHFSHSGRDWADFFALESKIEAAVTAAGGEYDGNELRADGAEGYIYIYGSDIDELLSVVRPFLASASFLSNIGAKMRYGPASDKSARVVEVQISPALH